MVKKEKESRDIYGNITGDIYGKGYKTGMKYPQPKPELPGKLKLPTKVIKAPFIKRKPRIVIQKG